MSESPQPKKRSAGKWYLWALVVLVASVAVFAVCYRTTRARVAGEVERLQHMVAPGSATVHVGQPGDITICYENKGVFGGHGLADTNTSPTAYDTPRRLVWPTHDQTTMSCTVTGPDGKALPVGLVDMITVYDTPQRQGHAVWHFEAPAAGDYRIAIAYKPEAVSKPIPVLMAVGPLGGFAHYSGYSAMYIGAAVLAFGGTAAAILAVLGFMLVHDSPTRRATDGPAPTP